MGMYLRNQRLHQTVFQIDLNRRFDYSFKLLNWKWFWYLHNHYWVCTERANVEVLIQFLNYQVRRKESESHGRNLKYEIVWHFAVFLKIFEHIKYDQKHRRKTRKCSVSKWFLKEKLLFSKSRVKEIMNIK